MIRPFAELRAKMSPESRESAEKRARALLAEMALSELRQSLRISQEELARELGMSQASLSRLERRTDMLMSSARKLVESLGGELVVLARFPDGDIRLRPFSDLRPEEAAEAG